MYIDVVGWLAGEIHGMRKPKRMKKKHCRSIHRKPHKNARLYLNEIKREKKKRWTCVRYMFHFAIMLFCALAVDYRTIRVDRASLNSTN